jgi:hypothetical protein
MARIWIQRFAAGIIGIAFAGASLAAPETPVDVKLLRRQYQVFQSYSPEKQKQIRELDEKLYELPDAQRERLKNVLERYASWLDALPEKSRAKVVGVSEPESRLAAIGELKTIAWVETLPKAQREEYEKAKRSDRPILIEKWKAEEEDRQERWKFALNHWNDLASPRITDLLQLDPQIFTLYLKHLDSQLPETEKPKLQALVAGLKENDDAKKLNLLIYISIQAERRPLIPGPMTGPKTYAELPAKVRSFLESPEVKWPKKGLPPQVAMAVGRWPDFALAVTRVLNRQGVTPPEPIVKASRKEEMPAEVVKYWNEEIEPRLKLSDAGRKALENLRAVEGKWPEYPETLMKIARGNGFLIPGWMPPKMPAWKKEAK